MSPAQEAAGQEGTHRTLCLRCLRPRSVCYCAQLVPVQTRTRVVLLQHPGEARMPIGTARMAHLSLPNSELHVGLGPEGDARLEAIAQHPETWILFPGPDAVDVATLAAPPRQLLVVDGTWSTARKLYARSPLLQQVKQLAFTPRRPSQYRIRAEPRAEYTSTIEAVCEVLRHWEGEPERFDRLLEAFYWMVDRQLEHAQRRAGPLRYKQQRKQPPRRPRLLDALDAAQGKLAAFYAEAEAWRAGECPSGQVEWAWWGLCREGQTSQAWLAAPSGPGPATADYLGVSASCWDGARPLIETADLFRQAIAGARVCTWGMFTWPLLRALGVEAPLDLRSHLGQVLGRRLGAIEDVAAQLPGPAQARDASGRNLRRLWALERVLEVLRKPGLDRAAVRAHFHAL